MRVELRRKWKKLSRILLITWVKISNNTSNDKTSNKTATSCCYCFLPDTSLEKVTLQIVLNLIIFNARNSVDNFYHFR